MREATSFRLTRNLSCKREKARTRVLNLLETPERAATLACSEFITSLLLTPVNTKKPLRRRRFSGRMRLEAPINATTNARWLENHEKWPETRNLKPYARRLRLQFLYRRQHLFAVSARIHAHIRACNFPLRINQERMPRRDLRDAEIHQ